jgi:DHA2 family multidrug resistance protein
VKGEARGLVANRGAITISIMWAPIMPGVDTTIANVALPHMQGSLSVAQDQIAWVLTSYIVAAAIMTPLTGWLAGRFGIKYVFLISVAGFTLASALCGSATGLAQLVIYRVLQGVCGAALVPLSQSVLLHINPPERHARAMAVWGTGTHFGPSYRSGARRLVDRRLQLALVFYINLPVGALATLGIQIFIRETRRAPRAVRLLRLRHVEPGDRRLTADARPRRAQGLVQLDRDLDLSDDRRALLLPLCRPHRNGHRPVFSEPRSAEGW